MQRTHEIPQEDQRLCLHNLSGHYPLGSFNPDNSPVIPMCEKCGRQTVLGTCTHPKSQHFLKICPGVELKADIRECDFAEIMPCIDKECQNCDGSKA